VSTPENPFTGAEPLAPAEPQELTTAQEPQPPVADAGVRFPVWTLGDVARTVIVLILAMFFCGFLAAMIAGAAATSRHLDPKQVIGSPLILIPAQFAAYVLTIWFVVRMISVHYGTPFFEGVHWHFPRSRWALFLGGGVLLAIFIQVLSGVLPIPKQLPIDQYFRNGASAWAMTFFGVLVAPFAEELFFRGLLFPALTVELSERLKTLDGRLYVSGWISGILIWGVAVKFAPKDFFIAAAVVGIIATVGLLIRGAEIAPVAVFWATFAPRSMPTFWGAVAPLALFVVLIWIRNSNLNTAEASQRFAFLSSFLFVAWAFALTHAAQLGRAWAPVLMLFIVGMVLTFLRARFQSVSASVLVHMGYNASLFAAAMLATDGFRHMEKLAR